MSRATPDRRPDASEYAEYAEYYDSYVSKVPDGPIVATLARQLDESSKLFAGISESRSLHRYAPGKWSVKEVLGHVVDVERIFACRALHFARKEAASIPGMDQDAYVAAAGFDARPFADIVAEFETLRRSHLTFFAGLGEADWDQRGVASGCEFTVRSIPWIIAGHEAHHRDVLRQRYL